MLRWKWNLRIDWEGQEFLNFRLKAFNLFFAKALFSILLGVIKPVEIKEISYQNWKPTVNDFMTTSNKYVFLPRKLSITLAQCFK